MGGFLQLNLNRLTIRGCRKSPSEVRSRFGQHRDHVLDGQGTQVGVMELGVPGVYEVSFEATNEYGCFDEMKKDIHVGDMNGLLALSRFSPNEDGRYDTFMPHGLKELTEAWEMVISDLNGTEVYRTSELNKPWNGTLPSGCRSKL